MKHFTFSIFVLFLLTLLGCKESLTKKIITPVSISTTSNISFVDEYIIPSNTVFDGFEIGGLSGITFSDDTYYLISDDPKAPRFFTATITLNEKGIDTVLFQKATAILDTLKVFNKKTYLDLEDIRTWTPNTLIVTGEGSIAKGLDPTLLVINHNGIIQEEFQLPSYFASDPENKNRPRHNGVFEGLAPSFDHKGIWTATELPLILDGPEPTFDAIGGPVRVTYFDYNTKKATSQFAYPLDKLSKDPKGAFGVNGVTAILQIDEHTFWILERAYSKGYGNQGNSIKIYEVITEQATNTLNFELLEGQKIQLASKKLLFDFETIRDRLTANIIDNIEGMTFGPLLPDGSHSLLLVSDNNFNPSAIQINQVLLFSYKK